VDDLGGDVVELLDHLGVSRAHYVGLSLGGMVGMWLAIHAPQRVDRLALLCTGACLPPAQGWYDRAATVRNDGLAPIADAVLARWFTPAFTDVDTYRQMLLGIPAEGYASCAEAIGAFDMRSALGAIHAPTLVIAGEDDPATPPPIGRAIADAVPGATFVVVPGAAHLANVERADLVTELLAGHLGV
jgi:3-oxoadipate enol-lactonase